MNDEISAIGQYQSKHSTCDIQLHPWQAVFGAGFEAGNSAAAARAEAAAQATIAQRDARIAELMAALTEAAWLMSNTPTDRPFSQEDVDADNEWYERADLWSERFDALMARTPAAPSAVAQEPLGERSVHGIGCPIAQTSDPTTCICDDDEWGPDNAAQELERGPR